MTEPLLTVSVVHPTVAAADERPFIDAVLEYGSFANLRVEPWSGPLEPWPLDEWRLDQPLASMAMPLMRGVAQAAAGAGMEVLLDGERADILSLGDSRRDKAAAPRPARRGWRPLARRGTVGLGWAVPLNVEFARRVGIRERMAELTAELPPYRTGRGGQLLRLSDGLEFHVLGLDDRVGARLGIDLRHPLHDIRLMELCLGMPAEQVSRAGVDRFVAREAMHGVLPEVVRSRLTGADHSSVFDGTLQTVDGELLQGIIQGDGPIWAYVERRAAREIHNRFRSLRRHEDAAILWHIGSMGAWLALRER